jgi:RNA polymerase sigma-70 factor (ECF subfamily)
VTYASRTASVSGRTSAPKSSTALPAFRTPKRNVRSVSCGRASDLTDCFVKPHSEALRRLAFEEMFVASRSRFIAKAYSILRNREDAEDAVQNAFLSGYRNLRRFEGRSALKTWFTSIVLNAALMIRRKRRNSRLDRVPDSTTNDDTSWIERIPGSEPDPETVYLREHTFQFVHALVEKMSPTLRQAFTLAYDREMSCVEAAAELGVKPTTFKARLFRARQHLIKQVARSLVASVRDRAIHSSRVSTNDEIHSFPVTVTETLPSERAFYMTEPIQSVPSSQGAK